MNRTILEIDSIRKRYGATHALNGVTLSVESGELFGLLGPNGAGKTTLLSIIAGLLNADTGSVLLDGQPFRAQNRELRRLIGIGTQDLAIYPDLTARENILFFGDLYGLNRQVLSTRADELLTAVGLQDRANHRAGTFSGGMKRRLNLAVAVVHSPRLLLLDEPTTGVDPQSRQLIFTIVKSLNSSGMTVVYTSHYMEEVQALCTRIAIVDRGSVIACDTLPELLRLRPSRLKIKLESPNERFEKRLGALDGVQSVTAVPEGLIVESDAIGPILPRLAEACLEENVTPRAIELNESTLERVFLHLTGHALRD